jgi:hypothetical protein
MNRIFLFVAFITLIFSEELRAQDETPRSLGNIIQQLSVDAPELSQESENDFIDPDFLKDEGKSFDDYPIVSIRILDKITAESRTFDLEVGKTVAYGSLRIRPMTCKKAPPIEEPESASFLQIWEKMHEGTEEWIFSGWMFSSSPALSAMEHPVYDAWVVDCKEAIAQ